MFDTPCKNCIFAKYEEKTQTDCDLGKLDLFREKGVEIIEAYDEEKEFYVVKERLCTSLRNKEWGEMFDEANWKKQIAKELGLKYTAIIHNDDKPIEDITKTFSNLVEYSGDKLYKVFIININQDIHRRDIFEAVRPLNTNLIPVRIEQPINPINEPENQIDLLVRTGHVAAPFYLQIYAGDLIKPNFLEKIEKSIFDDIKRFGAMTDNAKDMDITLYSVPIHVYSDGNKNETLFSKLQKENLVSYFNEL